MRLKHPKFSRIGALLGLVALKVFATEPGQAQQFQATPAVSPKGAEVLTSRPRPPAVQTNASINPKERELIAVLRSDSPPEEKAMACKQLVVYGSAEAVPALAPLLARFTSMSHKRH